MTSSQIFKRRLMLLMPKKYIHTKWYSIKHQGKKINWKNPMTYDEKIHWHIVNTYDESYGRYADKFLVREFVKEYGFEDLLIPLVGEGIYRRAEDIDFDSLPEEFILKTNHASGADFYYICKDKKTLKKDQVINQFRSALNQNYALKYFEYHYNKIKPLIICEKLLHDSTERMTDYKVVCSYGKPIAILVCSDRDDGRDYFSPEWEYLDYVKDEYKSKHEITKPSCLDQMLKAASMLSEKFPVARVDFYISDGKLYFGEITLTPSSGYHKNLTDYGQLQLGAQIPTYDLNRKR